MAGAATVASGANASVLAPGRVDVTGRGSDFAAAQIVTTAAVGLWLLTSYLECSTAGAGSGTMTTTWGWTDAVGARTDATQTQILTSTGLSATSSFTRVVYVTSGHLTIQCLITGAYLLGALYDLHGRAVFLG